MAGSPKKRARLEALKAAGLELPPKETSEPIDTADVPIAEEVANAAKADALLKHDGHVKYALAELGIPVARANAEVKRTALRVFNPEVVKLLHKRLGDLESQKTALIRRQVLIARYGAPEASTRAFQVLSRVAGWIAPLKVDVSGKQTVLNIHTVMQDPELLEQALDQLGHEPGSAIATSSDARDRIARRQAQPVTTYDAEVADGSHR